MALPLTTKPGCREWFDTTHHRLNSVFTHPCPIRNLLFGMLGIEPSLYAPEAYVLPVYYIPTISNRVNVRTAGILHPE